MRSSTVNVGLTPISALLVAFMIFIGSTQVSAAALSVDERLLADDDAGNLAGHVVQELALLANTVGNGLDVCHRG